MASDQLNRSWIGIDSSEIAIKTALGKLKGRVEPAQASLFTRANDNILYLAAGYACMLRSQPSHAGFP